MEKFRHTGKNLIEGDKTLVGGNAETIFEGEVLIPDGTEERDETIRGEKAKAIKEDPIASFHIRIEPRRGG